MADFQPGETLADRFEVVGTLGRGGMATVYLAHDRVRGAKVAIKVLHDHLAGDPSMRKRLRREVEAAGLVKNEAALVAYDLHPVGDSLALSMPFHPGTTLTERVRAEGPLTPSEVRSLGIRIASALADAHRRGVLHRDVTPNNVMLGAATDAMLTDFGLARTQDGKTATATSVLGTPGYAPPEVYSGQRTDPRSDLYSLGAVLYFAATGRSPFGAGSPAAILQAQLANEPESLRALCPDCPPDLVRTIESLLHRETERRPPSAQEVALALQAQRPVLVPEVPDTWNAEDEPLVPPAQPAEPPALVPADLPPGDWEIVVQGRRGCDANSLADNVGHVLALPPGSLEVTRPMRTRKKKFVLTRATDRPTAQRLAEGARTAGYSAQIYDVKPPNALQRLMSLPPLLIPLIWIAFPFFTLPELGLPMALLLSIAATILIPALTSPFVKRQPEKNLPLALSGDVSRHVVQGGQARSADDLDEFIDGLGLPDFLQTIAHEIAADGDVRQFAVNMRRGFQAQRKAPPVRTPPPMQRAPASTAQPAPKPTTPPAPKPKPTRAEDLRGRALGNIDLLTETLATLGDGLPALARADLTRTAKELREHAVELSRIAVGVEAGLAGTPEPADVSWVHGRLMRLETLARAGEAVDEAERQRLRAALESAESASSAREALESRLTSTLAQLLEIGAIATRARAELLAETDVPTTARLLVEQLDRQVEAVDATRRELGLRHTVRSRG